jgi:undecaprenyl-diphosphatase
MMGIFESIIMGLVQGLTEFIPVSSSGHLVLAGEMFGHKADHLFIQALDFGTLAALVIFFWPKLVDLVNKIFVQRDLRLLRNMILTVLPVGVIGLIVSKAIESSTIDPIIVSAMLGLVGLVMILLEKLPKLSDKKDGTSLTVGRATSIGLAQVLALIPGVSRSGSTIIASRIAGLKPRQAAEYSFMVSIPIMFGLVLKLVVSNHDYIIANWQSLLIGNIAAFVAGILAVKFMIGYLSNHSLTVFGWYRIAVATIFLALIGLGVVQ